MAGNYRICQTVSNHSSFNFDHICVANRDKEGKALESYVPLDPHDFWLQYLSLLCEHLKPHYGLGLSDLSES